VLEYLPVEYLSVSSQLRCILLTLTLSVLLTVNHHSASDADSDSDSVLVNVMRLLRLSLSDSRPLHLLMSAMQLTNLLQCFSALHVRLATEVSLALCLVTCRSLTLCVMIKLRFEVFTLQV